ncbi:SRPBCC domain-containing protein [Nesterenkonia jeotgali]|uniref:SRPBCC domain-containing protein n=1 Tax=Nesterenkonia jeotgali TaxID=317018 RepID=UPI0009FAF8D3|nr:SRPBCC domain-containing protein [Nesterenkonia jeotgali]
MAHTPEPTGTLGHSPHGTELQFRRRFPEPPEIIWAALTDSAQLQRWIGRWEGDPASGRVTFLMTAEGQDAPAEECRILDCTPPRSLTLETSAGQNIWHLRLALDHAEGTTTLLFAQRTGDEPLGSIGPGWEYYLDRLAAVLADRDPDQVAWKDYYPTMSRYYEQLED